MNEQSPVPNESVVVERPKRDILLSNRLYNTLKKFSLFIIPALAAAYFGIAQIWGLPKAEEVVGTAAVLETLIGVIIRVSSAQYDASDAKFDGTITTVTDFEEGTTELGVSLDPAAVENKDTMLVKVKRR